MKYFVRNSAIALVFTAVIMMPSSANAQTSSIGDMLSLIQNLLDQVTALQEQLNAIRGDLRDVIKDNLVEGNTDEDIRRVQKLLASDSRIYPEGLITGYYGPLTSRALGRLQRCAGIRESGELDSDTQDLIEAFLSDGAPDRESFRDFCKSLRDNKISNGTSDSDLGDDGISDDDSDEDNSDKNNDDGSINRDHGSKIEICHKGRKTISVGMAATRAHLSHGDTEGRCDNVQVTNDDDSDDDSISDDDSADDDSVDDDSADDDSVDDNSSDDNSSDDDSSDDV